MELISSKLEKSMPPLFSRPKSKLLLPKVDYFFIGYWVVDMKKGFGSEYGLISGRLLYYCELSRKSNEKLLLFGIFFSFYI